MVNYKTKCALCKKNYVIVSSRRPFGAICFPCQENDLAKEITDPTMKKLFDIPDQFYFDNSFLRNIKVSYLRYGSLTEKQVEAFKKAVEKMKEEAAKAK